MLMLIILCTCGAVTLFVLGITMKSEREIIVERIDRHTNNPNSTTTAIDIEMGASFRERVIMPLLRSLSLLARRLTPSAAQMIEERLETAGRPWDLGPTEFVGLKVLSFVALVAGGFFLARGVGNTLFIQVVLMAFISVIALSLPDYLLQGAINRRQSQIRLVLADTLDLLTVSVEAGLGLDGAMQRVIEKFDNPLSDEMNRALQEVQAGKVRAVALKDMGKRTKVMELITFVAAIVQADQLGVSISKVLRVQGETLRTLRGQRARETAAKLPVMMLFPLVFCIFPAIFVVILSPAAISIARSFGNAW